VHPAIGCKASQAWAGFTCAPVTAVLQGFVSASQRFTPAAAPIAAPDFNTFDGSTMRGDQTRLGPGTYLKLVSLHVDSGSVAATAGHMLVSHA
jgi:hypothetical protein